MPHTKEGRVGKARQTPNRRVEARDKLRPLVERTNGLNIQEFISRYMTSATGAEQQTPDKSSSRDKSPAPAEPSQDSSRIPPRLDVYSAASISSADLEACLDLIELTSSEAYSNSGIGWSRPKKRKEMELPDMKYLILRDAEPSAASRESAGNDADSPDGALSAPGKNKNPDAAENGRVVGFLSFMVTYEDGKEVVYCYEIHLAPEARGRGLGGLLMSRMEEIGRVIGLEKAMLTVFRSNEKARQFYTRGGYEVDEYSPQPRRLRNGTIKEFDYLILSKRLR
ncbi:hypothetical protein N7492_009491 [Penicillium capsulatum]|uniref:N-alpha-acetyltransferase 40 n=1 Tax=Penicillium capsulatum TaxID=69766 RepID=A0A9W9LHY8_9EURO|nr:hypothetical protein N7492_009491 [Penicillium capsulatum]KAJ6106881.1 hypothetical protein N7512_010398 [Penicillium capsulatum]